MSMQPETEARAETLQANEERPHIEFMPLERSYRKGMVKTAAKEALEIGRQNRQLVDLVVPPAISNRLLRRCSQQSIPGRPI